MDLSSVKKLSVQGIQLKQLRIDGILVYKSGYKNWGPFSIDTNGSIYNGTGFKDGYRVRSGGAEAAEAGARVTGYIPTAAGDIIRLTGWKFDFKSAANAVNFFSADFTSIGQFTTQPVGYGICANAVPTVSVSENVYTFTVPNNSSIRYLRVTGQQAYNTLPPEMIITINEEIK
jgi:hypothetical protein